jgi:hypothetical protein
MLECIFNFDAALNRSTCRDQNYGISDNQAWCGEPQGLPVRKVPWHDAPNDAENASIAFSVLA